MFRPDLDGQRITALPVAPETMSNGIAYMLTSSGKPALLIKLGRWLCMCMRNKQMNDELRARIRPLVFGRYACWCDKPSDG